MRKIIHISDMHFGKNDPQSTSVLLSAICETKPNLVIISGDLTQRALPEQFKHARSFLNHLRHSGIPCLAIPGNHDIEPLYKPVPRIFNPYINYKKYISDEIEPQYSDDEIAVASINTARASNIKNGSVNTAQTKRLEKWFSGFSPDIMRIIVSHHPFDLPLTTRAWKLARKSKKGMKVLSTYNIDLYLSGHFHKSSVISTGERYKKLGYHAIALQAGTISTRHRHEVQSFNLITIEKPKMNIETYLWDASENIFIKKNNYNFELIENSWKIYK